MDRQASVVSASRGKRLSARRAAVRIASLLSGGALFSGRDAKQNDRDDDDDLPRPNATISGLFPSMRLVRPALA